MRRWHGSEDEQLGRWVGAVVRRWAAKSIPAAHRRELFRRLLSQLTRARTTTGSTAAVTGSDPTSLADTTAKEWPPN